MNKPDGRSETSALNGKRGASKQWKADEPRTRRISARITPATYAWLTQKTKNVADALEALAQGESK